MKNSVSKAIYTQQGTQKPIIYHEGGKEGQIIFSRPKNNLEIFTV